MFDPITIAGLGLGVLQTGIGIFQGNAAKKRADDIRKRRVAYQTPEEIYKMMQMTQNRVQNGFDPATLNYLTNQTDRAFSSALGSATRLGADPNDLSAIFDQKMQSIMKVGAENAARNFENFKMYYGAMETLAANKAAEQKSKDDLLKDDLQSAAAERQDAAKNVQSGINFGVSALSYEMSKKLYKDPKKPKEGKQDSTFI